MSEDPTSGSAALAQLERDYLGLLLSGARQRAAELVMIAADEGVSIRDLYLRVFQPALYEVGRRWERNELSVAEEHYCTAATQLIMSLLYPRLFGGERVGRRLVATTVAGDLHELGARMVADFFELEGWDTYFTGSDTPTEAVLATVVERRADLLVVSATLPQHLPAVAHLIQRLRDADDGKLPVLVGGAAFNAEPDRWRRVGADGTAPDAQGAIEAGAALVAPS